MPGVVAVRRDPDPGAQTGPLDANIAGKGL
jgi:hypothetical protein